MRLPQDRILHIGTEIKDGKVNIVAEWQGELVRCRDCILTKERDEYTGRLWCSIHRGYMEDTYYCASGLRREDGEI